MSQYYKKKHQPDPLEGIFIALGKGIWFLVSWPFKKLFNIGKKSKFNQVQVAKDWMEIQKLLDSGDEIHAQQAVIRADKYFDDIMKQYGTHGDKFADRLRSLEHVLSSETYQGIWDAHKLRNQISHEVDHKTSVGECKSALLKFRMGMNGLGAI